MYLHSNSKASSILMYPKNLHNYYNAQYSVDMAIGSPNNKFRLIIDTGSGCTLINDSRCMSTNCKTRKAFNINKSDHLSKKDKQFKISYAQGEVLMEIVSDYFFFGNDKMEQEFGLILVESKIFEKSSFDGILGLSYKELAQSTVPFFDNLMNTNFLDKPVFSIYLERKFLSSEERRKADKMEISDEAVESHKGILVLGIDSSSKDKYYRTEI